MNTGTADTNTAATGDAEPETQRAGKLRRGVPKPAILVALVVLGDWLFFDRPVGISVALCIGALALGAALANAQTAWHRDTAMSLAVICFAVVPLLLSPTLFSTLLALAAVACFTVIKASKTRPAAKDAVYGGAQLLLDCGWRILPDVATAPWHGRDSNAAAKLTAWVMPLLLGATFVWLFAKANPIIEGWLLSANPDGLLAQISSARIAFWLLAFALVWPFVFVHIHARTIKTAASAPSTPLPPLILQHLFGKAALLRSLIVFNALFALQTSLDLAYLWGGIALPEGMTYAAYAHRGAYPLILTALLAAAFVVATMQPGTEASRSPLLKRLVYLWVAQNVLLVGSSLLRLDLYVEVYSLTYWRIAACVWMVLVAIGLVLIVVRIATAQSKAWLITANLTALVGVVYLCGFPNFPRFIADFNVQHSRELSGNGSALDIIYLRRLGPQTIPALDRFAASPRLQATQRARALTIRERLAAQHAKRMEDWRAWTYRDWQLTRYLNANPTPRLSDKPTSRLPAAQ
jgi:Domain of unknown function (DUF4153)